MPERAGHCLRPAEYRYPVLEFGLHLRTLGKFKNRTGTIYKIQAGDRVWHLNTNEPTVHNYTPGPALVPNAWFEYEIVVQTKRLHGFSYQSPDDDGLGFSATADAITANNATAIDDLTDNHPLLIGALGHAVVLTAVTFYPTMQGPQIVDAIVRDPWPTAPPRRSLTPQEWYNISFGARIRVQ
jgi:hypothetical protein